MANEVRLCGVPRRSFGCFPIAGKVPRRPQAAKFPAQTRKRRRGQAPALQDSSNDICFLDWPLMLLNSLRGKIK